MTDQRKDMPQDRQDGLNRQTDSRNRANQDAASRPGVDADNGMDSSGRVTDQPHEGSVFQPLQQDEPADRDPGRSTGQDGYVDQQGSTASEDYLIRQNQDRDRGEQDNAGHGSSHEGVSRGGASTQHGDAIRESQSAPGGGSVFQPLEADPSHRETTQDDKQRGNPSGQNQQGLGGRGEQRQQNEPRGVASEQNQRRP